MTRYNQQLSDPEAMEEAHDALREVYDGNPPGLQEMLDRLDDLVRPDPDLGTTSTLGSLRVDTTRYHERLADNDGSQDLRIALARVQDRVHAELDTYPGHDIDRHYSLAARRRNL